jgi:hypothetical protein
MQLSRWFLLLFSAAGMCGNFPVSARGADSAGLEETADEIIRTVVRLRGLDLKAPVQKGIKNRSEIASFINERIHEEYDRDELEKEGKMLRKLGFIPADIDYREYILKLLTEQVGGYYDQEKKIFYIASWLTAEEQKPVMVHELTHALQDQHFDIEKILRDDRANGNNDRASAHQALLEGDGMVVMLQSELDPIKRHFSDLPDLAFVMQLQMDTMQAQYAVFRNAPAFIQQNLLFPYGYGASFLQKVWKKSPGWQPVNVIYADLPASTEQIMHPEKYFGVRDNPEPVKPLDPLAGLGSDWKIAYQNVLGEFSLGLLLNLHLTEEHSRKSVSGWGGDQVIYMENSSGRDGAVVNTIWDTEEDAEKFYAAMDEWFLKRFPDGKRKNETSASFSLIQNGEFFEIQREGRSIRFVLGLPEADGPKWRGNN